MSRVAVAILVAVVSAGAARADHPQRLFPLKNGSVWTYENLRFGGETTMTATRVRSGGFRLAAFPGAESLRVRVVGHSVQAWDTRQRRWEALFRLGAARGTTYTVDLPPLLWRQVRVTVASRNATVRVQPLGRTFTHAVRLTMRPMPGLADAGMLETSFAPGYGLVSWKEQSIAGPVEHALARAEIAR